MKLDLKPLEDSSKKESSNTEKSFNKFPTEENKSNDENSKKQTKNNSNQLIINTNEKNTLSLEKLKIIIMEITKSPFTSFTLEEMKLFTMR